MTEYTFKTQKVYEDEEIDIPSSAREIEYTYDEEHHFDDSEQGWHSVSFVRVMWMEKQGNSVQ